MRWLEGWIDRYEQARFESVSDRVCDRHCYGRTQMGECCKCTMLICPAERLVRCCCWRDSASDLTPLLPVNSMQA